MGYKRRFEFGVPVDATPAPGPGITLAGRCYSGPIRVGDRFDQLVRKDGGVAGIDLYVKALEAYGHELDFIWEGLSAQITLEGAGAELVRGELVLRGCGDV
jgi:hypothetical protein